MNVYSRPSDTLNDCKKFSSRNSLRQCSAGTATSQVQLDTRTKKQKPRSSSSKMERNASRLNYLNIFGLSDPEDYEELAPESFVRIYGSFCYCLLCNKRERLLDDNSYQSHLDSRTHIDLYIKLRNLVLESPPDANSLHMLAISHLINKWIYKNSLSGPMIAEREAVINDFQDLLQSVSRECSFRVIGSFAYGASLSTSNLNLELIHPNSRFFQSDPRAKNSIHHKLTDPDAPYGMQFNNHTLHYDLVPNATETMYKIGELVARNMTEDTNFILLSDVNDLNSKIPKLRLEHKIFGVQLELSCHAETDYRMAELLGAYLSLDERAKYLSILVKYWARNCHISSPPGTYPPETYVILVIYFLQRTSPPILPCLHDIISKTPPRKDIKNSNEFNHEEKFETSEQIVRNLGRLSLDPTYADTNQQNQSILVENTSQEGVNDGLDEEDDDSQINDLDLEAVSRLEWHSENTSEVHTLFIEFMNFMMKDFSDSSKVISIRTLKNVDLASKQWFTQVKTIEHPLKPMTNISRVIGSHRIYCYIRSCFRYAYYYLTSIPLTKGLRQRIPQDDCRFTNLYIHKERFNFYFRVCEQRIKKSGNHFLKEMVRQNLISRDVEVINNLIKHHAENNSLEMIAQYLADKYQMSMLVPSDMISTKFCWLCKVSGHLRDSCSKAQLQRVENRPNHPSKRDFNLDQYFLEMINRDAITPKLSSRHRAVVSELTDIIRKGTKLDCKLELFGSAVNGLGNHDSDLDICLTLIDNPTGSGVNCVDTLLNILGVIQDLVQVKCIEPILTARVPILKFKYEEFDIDLSMYSLCAIHNSELLKTYSQIDPRLPQLFYLVKRYAKACGIADASKGSLSSYAWSLIVIHYLQQTNPPVLPVLQDIDLDRKCKSKIFGVNGWNVWFNKDVSTYSMHPYNDMSLTELFKNFFLYYGSFAFNVNVVSIRTRRLITRFQKNWTNSMMAIEDPFELTFNLSRRLDDQMALYILNSFVGAHKQIENFQRFASKLEIPMAVSLVEKIFDGPQITGQNSPPYRGCRHCHRVGHKIKDCPKKNVRKEGKLGVIQKQYEVQIE